MCPRPCVAAKPRPCDPAALRARGEAASCRGKAARGEAAYNLVITDLYSAFRSEDTEALDAAQDVDD